MALFLKSGPCFILPASGLFGRILDSIEYNCFLQSVLKLTNPLLSGGILSWMFIAMFSLNQLSFKIKFYRAETPIFYIANALCILTFGVILGLFAIRKATSSWKMALRLGFKFPPLVLLPTFGVVTFGPTHQGENCTEFSMSPRLPNAPMQCITHMAMNKNNLAVSITGCIGTGRFEIHISRSLQMSKKQKAMKTTKFSNYFVFNIYTESNHECFLVLFHCTD